MLALPEKGASTSAPLINSGSRDAFRAEATQRAGGPTVVKGEIPQCHNAVRDTPEQSDRGAGGDAGNFYEAHYAGLIAERSQKAYEVQ